MYHFEEPFAFKRSCRISLVVSTLGVWPWCQAQLVPTIHKCSSSHSTAVPSERRIRHTSRSPCGKTPSMTAVSPVGTITSSPTRMSPIRRNPTEVNTRESRGCALPEPTSPWRRRCMGCSVARSSKISLETFVWPSVRVKGSLASKASRMPSGAGLRATAGSWVSACRRRARATWRTKASSHLSRSRAAAMSALVRGRWIIRRASGSSVRPRPSRRAGGSGSTASTALGRTASTALAIFQDSSLVVAG
ncbi:hypothetical protein STANM309S_02614 [Streptomyces tanashiensis]